MFREFRILYLVVLLAIPPFVLNIRFSLIKYIFPMNIFEKIQDKLSFQPLKAL